jgi:phage tail protein X
MMISEGLGRPAALPAIASALPEPAPYILHITIAGERWDTLAWNYYGDPTNYSGIVMANPGIPIEPAFEPGLLVQIPIISQSQAAPANLPPWKTL